MCRSTVSDVLICLPAELAQMGMHYRGEDHELRTVT